VYLLVVGVVLIVITELGGELTDEQVWAISSQADDAADRDANGVDW
jgi:hypothetical protein